MSKLSDARDFIQMYGVNYGWEWDKAKGLTYTPTAWGDEWDLANDADAGNWAAQELVKAINLVTVKEHNDALHNIRRRKQPNANELTDRYEQRAVKILTQHREDLRNADSPLHRLMLARNYHRTSEYDESGRMIALRQNPRELGTLAGLGERVERSSDIIFRTLAGPNAQKTLMELGINSDAYIAGLAVLKAMGNSQATDEFKRRVAKIYAADYTDDPEAKKADHGTYFYTLAEKIYTEYEEMIEEAYNTMSVEDKMEILNMKEMGTLADALGL